MFVERDNNRMVKKSEKSADVPRGVVIVLLLAIIIISVINTLAILNFINNAKIAAPVSEATTVASQEGGTIKLTLIEAPKEEVIGEENE